MKVLIVEDSPSVVEILKAILESDDDIEVAGVAVSGEEAIDFVRNNDVDVVTMDYNLKGMNGIEATKEIMYINPKPIIIMSGSFNPKNTKDVFRAMEAGALTVFDKPHSLGSKEFDKYAKDLIRHVKMVSGVKVVTRRRTKIFTAPKHDIYSITKADRIDERKIKLIAMGASTGGPQVLKEILCKLDKNYPVPIVAVQHITEKFTEPFINWLNDCCEINIKIADNNEQLQPGFVYFAQESKHLTVSQYLRATYIDSPPVHSAKPSVSKLFESISFNVAPSAVAILLTGMGRDGAFEMKTLKDTGVITIAQDEESCVVFGMPKEAIALGGALHIFSADEIANFLIKIGELINGT